MKLICGILVLLVLQNCAPSRYVKPLTKGQKAISFTFGGPLIKFGGAPIPIPFTTLGYGFGITDDITVYGNLHTTSLLFGNAQTDLGATFNLYKKENTFGITAAPSLQLAYNIRNKTGFRVWPSADVNAYFHLTKKPSYLYAGLNSWFELSTTKEHNETQQKHIIPNIHLGYTVVKTKWQHQFEFKYLGLGMNNQPGVVDYIGVSGKGTLGLYYSLIRKF
ncbi:hypothetical protein [Aurantibacillus circumpalustris]|uniref:hypothetical protein n=1 Tax=Aurantibacillus circumpalustris TaxID=3036359 RepID=UPI00295B3B56|nr:hypothetical protein [Aurantibacillus circumpalustris]